MLRFEAAIRAHVRLEALGISHRTDGPVFQEGEQPGLQGGGKIADFREKEGPVVGESQSPRPVFPSYPGKAPLRWAEDFGFQECLGESPAVHLYERTAVSM